MISLQQEKGRFNYRVAGVFIAGGQVLIHRMERDDFWALPGGRCEMGETSAAALRREMQEELASEVAVGRLLWVVENFFVYEGFTSHEIGFYYLADLPSGSPWLGQPAFTISENGLTFYFRWLPLAELPATELYPTFLKSGLQALPEAVAHVIHIDE